jgi:hypothetical protein
VIVPLAGLVLLLLPALLGGRPSRLTGVRLRWTPLLLLALVAQTVSLAGTPTGGRRTAAEVVHVGSYLVAGAVVVRNRRVPGLWLIALGALSNGLTIALNGGTLPARPQALRAAGLPVEVDAFANSGALSEPRLWFLGDVFAVPAGVPLANVFSVGDVLILAGVLLASVRICGTRWNDPVIPPPDRRPVPEHPGLPLGAADAEVD